MIPSQVPKPGYPKPFPRLSVKAADSSAARVRSRIAMMEGSVRDDDCEFLFRRAALRVGQPRAAVSTIFVRPAGRIIRRCGQALVSCGAYIIFPQSL